jgi:hypothetical protein
METYKRNRITLNSCQVALGLIRWTGGGQKWWRHISGILIYLLTIQGRSKN